MNVLITGSSSGFGRLIVDTLLEKGHTVVGTMRGVAGKNKEAAAELSSKGVHVVELDVTDEASVNAAIEKAIELTGNLDVVVNNAGIGVMGIQEMFTVEDMHKVFNVNVYGVHRVNRAVLPHMRANGRGLLIHISSLLGRMTLPFYGPYNATKWALEALVENYRSELSQYGVESTIVQPGGFPTDFFGNLVFPSDESRAAEFGDFVNAPQAAAENFGATLEQHPEQNPQLVADVVLELIEGTPGERPFRTTVDKIGMGDQVNNINIAGEQVTNGLYGAFGMANMLKVNTEKY